MSGEAAAQAIADAARRTVSRRELERNHRFSDISPEVGVLDEDAFAEAMAKDPDETLGLLADMAVATDSSLRELARSLAARIFLDVATAGIADAFGAARLVYAPADVAEGDLDLDRSLDELVSSRSSGSPVDVARLQVTTWRRPRIAVCMLVDRSGSMQGRRLATAAIGAAAAMLSKSTDCSVIAFSDNPIVLRQQRSDDRVDGVLDDLLTLRGSGVTNLTAALNAARVQLTSSDAARRITLILSDCRVTSGGDPEAAARMLDEVIVLAPEDDSADATSFAERIGARCATYGDPLSMPGVINQLLSDT